MTVQHIYIFCFITHIVSESINEIKIFELFQNLGLNQKESDVFLTLIKSGKKGNIVKELTHSLPVERTTLYSILKKLIKLGFIYEGGKAEKSKNATIFIANSPKKLFRDIINQKEEELKLYRNFKSQYSEFLQNIYDEGFEVPFDEIDPAIQPYFLPLIEKNWKIKSYIFRKDVLDYEVYDCMLYSPKAKLLKDNSYHIFLFNHNIEEDENALRFFSQGLKRKTKEMKSYFFDTNLEFVDGKIEFFNKSYPCFKMMIQIKDLKSSSYFASISDDVKLLFNESSEELFEIGKAVIIPIGEKLFYLWAESDKILKEMVEPIFRVEKM